MAKESEKITRVDVRIPNEIYEQINQIAIETNQPVHHRSGKPVVTPIILNLINLGLEAVEKKDFNLESLTDKLSGINQIDIKAIEDKVTANLADKLSGINQVEIEASEKKLLASIEDKLESIVEAKVNEVLDHISKSNTESELDDEIKSESISYFPEENEEEEIVESEDTLNNLSLNQTQLAKRLGYKTHSTVSTNFKKMSKGEFIKWSKGKDPEGKGWYKVGDKFKIQVTNF